MKKLLLILVAWVVFSHAMAQSTATDQRTSTTKIADVLALQPASTDAKLQEAYAQLERFSVQDIASLLQGLKPQGANNAALEYLSNSYSLHVGKGLNETARKTFVDGAIIALGQLSDPFNKGYVIQLLQHAAKDEAVSALKAYLSDDILSEKSARALARIQTPAAGEALLQALQSTSGGPALQIINALGFMRYQPAEKILLEKFSDFQAPNASFVVNAALSRLGTQASLEVLQKAAQHAGYQYDETNSLGAYLDLLFRLQKEGQLPQVARIAQDIIKATSNNPALASTRAAALNLLVGQQPQAHTTLLRKVALSDDAIYRDAAFRMFPAELSASDRSFFARKLAKAAPETQVDLLHFLVAKNAKEVIAPASKLLHSTKADPSSQKAALFAIKSLQGELAVPVLIQQLTASSDENLRTYASILLSEIPGQHVPNQLFELLQKTQDPALQTTLLGLLGDRGDSQSTTIAFALARQGSTAEVKAAAVRALAATVQPTDLNALLGLYAENSGSTVDQVLLRAITNTVDRSSNRAQAIGQIIAAAQSATSNQQQGYRRMLATLGGEEALAFVVGGLKADATQKNNILRVLSSWKDANALPYLRQEIAGIQDSETFDVVFRGINSQITSAQIPSDQKLLLYREAFDHAKTNDQKKVILRSLEGLSSYQALIFASQYLNQAELKETAVNTVMNIALANPSFYGEEVNRLLDIVIGSLGGGEGNYIREAVIRHKAELPQGKGFVSLFNGQDLTGWKGLVENPIKRAQMDANTLAAAQQKADATMRSGWYVEDGSLHFNGKGDNIATTKQYGDFEMLVDWKLDPSGKEGDAGIYLRGTPQVQIWDISRVEVGAQVGSGGLYNNQKNPSKPLLVADNPLGEWNTFRIRMVGDKVTVYLNGQLVTDEVVLENYWDRSSPIFPLEQIELQAHGTKVSYRDLYIRELPRKEVFELSEAEKKEGFEVLFDGTHLDHWIGNKEAYIVTEENTLGIFPTKGSGGNLYTKEIYGDFVYRFDFKLTPGANNGIGIRTPLEGDAAYVGMEIQVLDDTAPVYKDLAPYQYHGSVYGIIAAKKGFLRPVGEWNSEEIYIKGNHIRVTLNGQVIVDGDLEKVTKNGTLDKQDHPGLKRKDGHIAFLGHGSEVQFKNIRVKRL